MTVTEHPTQQRDERGFTLIELLVSIVVVAILAAVAIVGVGGLQNKGSSSACQASVDAAKAASAVHYANTGSWPTTFDAMTGATPAPEFEVASGVTATGTTLKNGSNWSVTMGGGGSSPNTFTACP